MELQVRVFPGSVFCHFLKKIYRTNTKVNGRNSQKYTLSQDRVFPESILCHSNDIMFLESTDDVLSTKKNKQDKSNNYN